MKLGNLSIATALAAFGFGVVCAASAVDAVEQQCRVRFGVALAAARAAMPPHWARYAGPDFDRQDPEPALQGQG